MRRLVPNSDASSDERFVLARKPAIRDYSNFAVPLGPDFVERACQEVRNQRDAAGVLHRTWLDNYVVPLGLFFAALTRFCSKFGICGYPVTVFKRYQWDSFAGWFSAEISRSSLAKTTRSKRVNTLNKLWIILNRVGVIPLRLELPREQKRKIAKDGESRFTIKGHLRIVKSVSNESPYEFHLRDHDRAYCYEQYAALGHEFITALVSELPRIYLRLKNPSAKQMHESIRSLFTYACAQRSAGTQREFFAQLASADFRSIPAIQWESLLYGWREEQGSRAIPGAESIELKTAHQSVKRIARLWLDLARVGITPKVDLIGYKGGKRGNDSRSRRSFAQLSPAKTRPTANQREVITQLSKFCDESEREEMGEFVSSLCHVLSPSIVKRLTTVQIIDEIRSLNKSRLSELRKCAEGDFLKWSAHWSVGERALAASQLPASELLHRLDSSELAVSERRRNATSLLFRGHKQQLLGNALNYVLATQGGISTGIHGRYHHIMRAHGDRFAFHAYLHPHPHATLALWVLLLVDTGANCEVAREMPFDCLSKANDPLTRRIQFAPKGRANGKVIFDELPVEPTAGQRISAIQAIERYKQMSGRYHAIAVPPDNERLFLSEYKCEVHLLSEFTARNWFKLMGRRHKAIGELSPLPSMIRPSVLLDVAGGSFEGLLAAQSVGDHASTATQMQHYGGRAAAKMAYNIKIREFQDRFQAVVIATIDGASQKLGLSQDQFRRIFSSAARTGLGVACLEPLAGIQPGTIVGEDCTRLDACCNCAMRWVVATVDNVSDLILFHDYLDKAQEDAALRNSESWETRWLPWLVFTDIALTKLSQGATATVFRQASEKAEARRPTYRPIPLF